MKYYPRSNQYRASNVVLNMGDNTAWSYGWWAFLMPIKGKLVFNQFYYSPTTYKHQRKVKAKLYELGITPDLFVEAPYGLQGSGLKSAITYCEERIQTLMDEIAKPRSKGKANQKRHRDIQLILEKKRQILELLK